MFSTCNILIELHVYRRITMEVRKCACVVKTVYGRIKMF